MVQGMTRLVTLTAPGADVLPWDEEHCAWMGPHKHSGPLGCRIEVEAANAWAIDLEQRFHRLCAAARKRGRISEPVVCARAWEAQDRGAPHCHMVTIVNAAGERFVEALFELAPLHGFGTIHDKGYAARGGYAHASYLSKYVTKDGYDEHSRRESVFEASLLPRQTVWVSAGSHEALGRDDDGIAARALRVGLRGGIPRNAADVQGRHTVRLGLLLAPRGDPRPGQSAAKCRPAGLGPIRSLVGC